MRESITAPLRTNHPSAQVPDEKTWGKSFSPFEIRIPVHFIYRLRPRVDDFVTSCPLKLCTEEGDQFRIRRWSGIVGTRRKGKKQ
ncbi:hypothetical protein JTE90_005827 [Oedothorax gibbosus]|uniref:Uncharacterized protein n=1 Tax=Oedothorax gibbosus TaxID=931172 RepID=A0AAV6V3F7_9ARAC|nr:hypothetical protein JTE90_005827 [Oedothorax gibbosus]